MESAAEIVWQVHRRPGVRVLAFAALCGVVLAILSTVLIRSLMLDPSWLVAVVWGVGIGLLVPLSLLHGSSVRVEQRTDGRMLIYALRGTDMIAVPASAIRTIRMVQDGALSGLACEVPIEAIDFLSRKGPTRRHCETHRDRFGSALVLEFLTAADAPALAAALDRGDAMATAASGPSGPRRS